MKDPVRYLQGGGNSKTEQQQAAGGSHINLLKGEQDTIREREEEKGKGGWKVGVGFEVGGGGGKRGWPMGRERSKGREKEGSERAEHSFIFLPTVSFKTLNWTL